MKPTAEFNPKYRAFFRSADTIRAPRPARVIGWMVAVAFALISVFLVVTPWVQTSMGAGTITSFHPNERPQAVTAMVSGRINSWFVHEGSLVKKGDPILEIIDNDPNYLQRLQLERDAVQKQYDVAKIAAETANIDYVRKGELLRKGLASRKDFETAKINYKTYLAKEAYAAAELAKTDVRLARQATQRVVAPADGMIVNIRASNMATFVKEGEPLATFVPDNAVPAVEIFVSGLDAPLVHAGRKVRLQFEGWPAVQFSGWPSVAIGTFGGIVKSVDPSVSVDGRFRVLVVQDPAEAWPAPSFLRFGAQARGWVLLDTVSVGYEIWRQLNNFPPNYPREVLQKSLMQPAKTDGKSANASAK